MTTHSLTLDFINIYSICVAMAALTKSLNPQIVRTGKLYYANVDYLNTALVVQSRPSIMFGCLLGANATSTLPHLVVSI